MLRSCLYSMLRSRPKQKKTGPIHGPRSPKYQIPDAYKHPVRISQETYNMQVPSQAITDSKHIMQIILEQRKKLKEIDDSFKPWAVPKMLIGLAGINVVGVFACMAVDRCYLGMWVAGILHPSFVAASAMMIGYNAAFLIMRHSLKMHLSDRELQKQKELNLLESPLTNWINVAYLTADMFLLMWVSGQLMVGASRQLLAGYVILALALIWQASWASPKAMPNTQKTLKLAVLAYCVIYGIYLMSYLIPEDQLKGGIDKVRNKYMFSKIMVKEEPINISLKEEVD